jgi:hypothetical protein
MIPTHGLLGMDLLSQASGATLDFKAMRLDLKTPGGEGFAPAAVANECRLPPDFACQSGFSCSVKFSDEVKCYVDRIPTKPFPGNALPKVDESGEKSCVLPSNFTCPPNQSCIADDQYHIRREPAPH